MNYLARLAQLETRQSQTDRTDKSTSVGFVSSIPARIERKTLNREALDRESAALRESLSNEETPPALAPTDRQLIEAVCRIWEADAEDLEVALEAARRDPSLIDCWRGSAVRLGLIRGRLQ